MTPKILAERPRRVVAGTTPEAVTSETSPPAAQKPKVGAARTEPVAADVDAEEAADETAPPAEELVRVAATVASVSVSPALVATASPGDAARTVRVALDHRPAAISAGDPTPKPNDATPTVRPVGDVVRVVTSEPAPEASTPAGGTPAEGPAPAPENPPERAPAAEPAPPTRRRKRRRGRSAAEALGDPGEVRSEDAAPLAPSSQPKKRRWRRRRREAAEIAAATPTCADADTPADATPDDTPATTPDNAEITDTDTANTPTHRLSRLRLLRRQAKPLSPEDEAARDATAKAAFEAFDRLYQRAAPGLLRQVYLLTGNQATARNAVEYAFHTAWEHWPEVARDRDPQGWLRARAYDHALSPWRRVWPRGQHRRDGLEPFGEAEDRELWEAVLALPPSYRRALLLYDGVGLDLPETAAEIEASTPAAAGRLTHAREALAAAVPRLAAMDHAEQGKYVHERLRHFAAAQPVRTLPLGAVRHRSERRTELWTKRTVGLAAAIALGVVVTTFTADDYSIDKVSPVSVTNWSLDDESPKSREATPEAERPEAR
ncbi:sigma factor-like helix-turn-helix DNA-binding protein [Streptomyces boninensis]|uniref:sigma factor-like helix-turn-helix DNA-binding protein n=1 Tax=Streptomyces boninensis TaxID=2039455 RepID=UPI003B213323